MLPLLVFLTVISSLSSSVHSTNERSQLYDDSKTRSIRSVRDIQASLNEMVDEAVDRAKNHMNDTNSGKWDVQDINEKFSTGEKWWKVKGEFKAKEGTFEDLRSIYRAGDVLLEHEGSVYKASCEFELAEAYLKYNDYMLKYGPVKVDGKLSASFEDIRMCVNYTVTYTPSSCESALQEVRLTKMGDLSIDATGLGALSHLYSKLITWVSDKWRDDVISSIEERLGTILEENLKNFKCEKLRPE